MAKETGGSAYPCIEYEQQERRDIYSQDPGMTLRDAFAIAVAPNLFSELHDRAKRYNQTYDNIYSTVAGASYEFADAMLKARKE